MRKIEKQMLDAIHGNRAWHNNNTRYAHDSVYLHENLIALIFPKHIKVSLAGWDTNTTRSRLNAILYALCGATIGRERGVTWIRFRQHPYTSGPAGYAPNANEWVKVERT